MGLSDVCGAPNRASRISALLHSGDGQNITRKNPLKVRDAHVCLAAGITDSSVTSTFPQRKAFTSKLRIISAIKRRRSILETVLNAVPRGENNGEKAGPDSRLLAFSLITNRVLFLVKGLTGSSTAVEACRIFADDLANDLNRYAVERPSYRASRVGPGRVDVRIIGGP